MRLTHQLVLASTSRHKLKEFRELLTAHPGFEIVPVQDFARNAYKIGTVEKFDDYLENAEAKARLVSMGVHYPVLADDTGLEVDALDGKPGVRSHRFAKTSDTSANAQDIANVELLLSELAKNPQAPRTARFICVLVLLVEGVLLHTRGVLEGKITDVPRGRNGFGYDSVFVPNDTDKTLAEMTSVEKNAISHRARAMQELMNLVRSRGITLAKP